MNQKEGKGKKNIRKEITYRAKSLVRMLDIKLLIKNSLYLYMSKASKRI